MKDLRARWVFYCWHSVPPSRGEKFVTDIHHILQDRWMLIPAENSANGKLLIRQYDLLPPGRWYIMPTVRTQRGLK